MPLLELVVLPLPVHIQQDFIVRCPCELHVQTHWNVLPEQPEVLVVTCLVELLPELLDDLKHVVSEVFHLPL